MSSIHFHLERYLIIQKVLWMYFVLQLIKIIIGKTYLNVTGLSEQISFKLSVTEVSF